MSRLHAHPESHLVARIEGVGKTSLSCQEADTLVISLESGNVNAGVSTLDSSLSLLGKCSAQP